MYGFHKRVGLSDNSMKASERKNKSPSEYYNPYFKRGHPNLLWLINKPKSGSAQKKKGRTKTEEGADESDEDNKDGVEETFSGNYGQGHQGYEPPRAISVAPESGPLQRQELTLVQKQLRDIQNQQNAISNAIARLRKEHHDLYQQAVAFQTLHDRHESSINAILTFLATVYNRSLDGQGVPNIGQMFGNAMAQDQMHQGSVVDLGNLNQQGQTPGNLSPLRRAQRLIMAPPNSNQAMSAVSTPSTQNAGSMSSAGNYRMSSQTPKQSGAIEELFDKSPSAKSPSVKPEVDPTQPQPQQNIMELINNTNAQAPLSANKMDFPDVLHHYENANGNSPLTNEQRNDMLQLIANTSGGSNNNINALVSPAPPPNPTLEQLGYTQQEIDELIRMQQDQDAKIHNVSAALGPLTPSGSIPGLDNGAQYFNNGDVSPLGSSNNLDLDQFLDSGAYYTNGDGGTDFGYDAFGNPNVGTAGAFDFGLDNAADGMSGLDQGKVVGGSSGAPSPTVFEEQAGAGSSPNRKRRKG
jgi:heat shock transcription factor